MPCPCLLGAGTTHQPAQTLCLFLTGGDQVLECHHGKPAGSSPLLVLVVVITDVVVAGARFERATCGL